MRKPLLLLLCALSACSPDLPRDEPGNYVVALFDPGAAVPVVPTPSSLAVNAGTGLLEIADAEDATEAEKQFNRYLRTLDGFPVQATATAPFSAAIDPATVTAATVRILDVTDPAKVTPLPATELNVDAAKKQLSVKADWSQGRSYVIALLGGDQGLKGTNGERVVGSPALLLVRAKRSLVTCADLAASDCKATSSLISGATEEERTAKAVKLERYRRVLEPGVTYLEANGVLDWQLAGLWGFRTVQSPVITFDPAKKIVPFPNDLLMANGRVNLPADAADDAATASLKLQLNELDGFSTTAALLTESGRDTGAAAGRLDALTLSGGQFLLVNMANPSETVPVEVRCRSCGNGATAPGEEPDQVALVPQRPLRSHTRYAVFWLRGARQHNGVGYANTGSIFALTRLSTPLWENNASMLSTVDVLTAALLEPLRVQTQPLLAITDVRGIPREEVLLAWSFTTQTTTEPLAALRNKPVDWNLPTAVTGPATAQDFSLLATASQFTGADWHTKIRAVYEGTIASGLALSEGFEIDSTTGLSLPTDAQFSSATLTAPRATTLKFLLALPKVPKFSDGRIPVIIFQHGLGRHRRDAALIANSIAKKGYATLAIDAPFHGERSYCRADNQCQTGTQCVDHRCPGGYASADTFSGMPDISGQGFVSGTNPFATRDHFRQHVIDLAQLVRSLKDTTNGIGGLSVVDDPTTAPRVERLDPSNIRYIGQSLGGIIGTLATAAIPELTSVTLNVPGADPVGVSLTSPQFQAEKANLDTYLASRGIATGSQRYEEFMDTARWILDPADPQNYGRHLISEPLTDVVTQQPGPRKRVFVSWVQGDLVVPNPTTELLLRSIITDPSPANFQQTKYTSGSHALLIDLTNAPAAMTAQTDAVNWVDP